jgi:hypothetical protein
MALLGSEAVKEPLTSRLLFPLTERRFTYDRYADWLARLDPRRVVPLRELAAAEPPVVGLRHDVDDRLDSAVTLARLEHARGIRASYFVLHTARYWRHDDRMLSTLRTIQDELGHEIGFHHDPVTLYAARVDIAAALSRELEWLRDGGLDVRGAAAHGSAAAHALRCHNNYFFRGWDEPLAGFDRTDVPKLDPSDLGLEYEAYHVPYDVYVSDSRFGDGRRTHPESFDPATLAPSERAVVLVHPCHWDRSPAAKTLRLAAKARRRGARLLSRR